MANFPQQHEVHFPGNASATADPPWNVALPRPQLGIYPVPVLRQPRGYAGVVPDDMVSIGVAMISHSQGAHMCCAILVSTC